MSTLRQTIAGLLILSALTACSSADQGDAASTTSPALTGASPAVRPAAAASVATVTASTSGAASVTTPTRSPTTAPTTTAAAATLAAGTTARATVPNATSAESNGKTTGRAPTTPVTAPGGGNINQTVPEIPVTTKAAVSLSATATYGTGVTATLVKIVGLKTTAQLPGEIAGPGVAVTVRITNSAAKSIDLGSVLVDVQDAAGTPSIPMTALPASPLRGHLAPGKAASGVYVFTLGTNFQGQAHILVGYSAGAPIALFVGNVG